MVPLDKALAELVTAGLVSFDDALAKSSDPDKLREYAGRSGSGLKASRSAVY